MRCEDRVSWRRALASEGKRLESAVAMVTRSSQLLDRPTVPVWMKKTGEGDAETWLCC